VTKRLAHVAKQVSVDVLVSGILLEQSGA
jgi:hypothetical protein